MQKTSYFKKMPIDKEHILAVLSFPVIILLIVIFYLFFVVPMLIAIVVDWWISIPYEKRNGNIKEIK